MLQNTESDSKIIANDSSGLRNITGKSDRICIIRRENCRIRIRDVTSVVGG